MRVFRDPEGTEWQVWKVVPVSPLVLERRRGEDDRRRDDGGESAGEGRRVPSDRRSAARGSLKDGWLCFQAGERKRRLVPVPADWESCSEQKLFLLYRAASTVRGRPGSAG
ncbi:MAG: hypothetical protein JO040_00205 [Gemmatimonadetes bacterium]|nr:hypothetical protein [Gemmatimonadota bacterium]